MDAEREFGELTAKVEGISVRLDEVRTDMRDGFARLETALQARLEKHSQRLGALEQWRNWLAGAISAVGLKTLWELFRR